MPASTNWFTRFLERIGLRRPKKEAPHNLNQYNVAKGPEDELNRLNNL